MSNTAEDISSTLTSARPGETSDDRAEAIAELLIGDDESLKEEENDEETQTIDSTPDDDEESSEEEEADDSEEETTLETVEDGDVTWESVLGVSEESLSFDENGNVVGFKTKVNGEEEIVKANDLIAGYQNNKHVTQKSQALSEAMKSFEVQKEQLTEQYAKKLESVDALTKHFETRLVADYDAVDWENLRITDPAEYAAARHDFSMKAQELNSIKSAIENDRNAVSEEAKAATLAKQQEYLKTQYEKMLINNPEWSDENTRNQARDSFKSFVKDQYGFTEADWDMVNDARLIELVKDAKKYRDGATVASKKRTVPVPKFQKSRGAPQKRKTSKLDKLTAASRNARGSAKRDLQQSAVAELLLGG